MPDKNRYNNFEAELIQIRQYLSKYNTTATMVAVALDIYRPNLCRHKITLQIKGLLVVTHRAECKVTGYQADYLSCNPDIVKGVFNGK